MVLTFEWPNLREMLTGVDAVKAHNARHRVTEGVRVNVRQTSLFGELIKKACHGIRIYRVALAAFSAEGLIII